MSEVFVVGIEKKRQRLMLGPIFGKNMYYAATTPKFGLTGFLVDYSVVFFKPNEKYELYAFAQFQYNYEDHVVYYEPPSQSLILSSSYKESIYGFGGIGLKINVFKNFQFLAQSGLGIESMKTQVHYPYFPSNNKYRQKIWLTTNWMVGITYGFPIKKSR